MCGIVGYLGKGDAYPALIKGLKRLEYRGYDSAGVALISNDGSLNVYKAKGKVADLEAFCSDKDISGHVGICLLYTSPSPRDRQKSRMPSSA